VLTAEECRALAQKYKIMSQAPNISNEQAFILKNISRSYAGLATQLDTLAVKLRDERK
jgi:hypothetical protein